MIDQVISWLFVGAAASVAFFAVMYVGGWSWSRGYYRGKREFLNELTTRPPIVVKGKHSG